MKKILVILFTILVLLSAQNVVFAQESISLATVTYQTRDDLDILFAHSSQPLDYFEGEEIDKPTFVGLFTESQLESLRSQKFTPAIIETNPAMDQFTLFYHPRADQSDKLKPFGTVFSISSHLAFVKQPEGEDKHNLIEAEGFFEMHLDQPIVTPRFRTRTITEVPTIIHKKTPAAKPARGLPLMVFIVLIPLFPGAGIVLKKRGWKPADIILTEIILAGIFFTFLLLFS